MALEGMCTTTSKRPAIATASFFAVFLWFVASGIHSHANAQLSPQLPDGFALRSMGDSWSAPVDIVFIDESRSLVAEKGGTIWLVENDLKTRLILDLSQDTLNNGDRGLLSIAVQDLGHALRLFCFLTVDPFDADNLEQSSFLRLSRYDLITDAGGELAVDPSSRFDLIGNTWSSGIPSCHFSHACGSLHFLRDGSLVVGAGDGAHFEQEDSGGLDPDCFGADRISPDQDLGAFRACTLESLAGKILRLDPETGLGLPDNPFFNGNIFDSTSMIYCRGLRNPFRFSLVGDEGPRETLLIADVGWRDWEELNLSYGGEHFGWPCFEAQEPLPGYRGLDVWDFCVQADASHTPPWIHWNHFDDGTLGFRGRSATGLELYDGESYPHRYHGALFFCDYVGDWIRVAQLGEDKSLTSIEPFAEELDRPVQLKEDPFTGDLICLSLGSPHRVFRIQYLASDAPPTLIANATPRFGEPPLMVEFDASSSSDPEEQPLSFLWNFGDGQTSTQPNPNHVYDQVGSFEASITITDVDGNARTESFAITPGNNPPQIDEIVTPFDGLQVQDGDLVSLLAQVSDIEDDQDGLPLRLRWRIDRREDHSSHPDWLVLGGLDRSFPFEVFSPGTHYRILFEVEDSWGAIAQESRTVFWIDDEPRPDIVSVSDDEPREGQSISVEAHVDFPIDSSPGATLVWDWGDGSDLESDLDVSHQSPITRQHTYPGEGTYLLTLTTQWMGHENETSRVIEMRRPRPAVAIFYPYFSESRMTWIQQRTLAQDMKAQLESMGIEARLFTAPEQDSLATWMGEYLQDGVTDWVFTLDTIARSLYAGEDDGSLAELWLENGNGLFFTGDQPFEAHVGPWGSLSEEGAGAFALDEILEPSGLLIGYGLGDQWPTREGRKNLPGLRPFRADRGLHLTKIGPEWRVRNLFATDPDQSVSDAVILEHQSGGLYGQCYCITDSTSSRPAPMKQILETLLFGNRTSDARDLPPPTDR